jgi:hypothetical protein
VTRPPRDLTAAVFRALYRDHDLHTHGTLHIVTPAGTPVYISGSLGQIARQLTASRPDPGPAPPPLPARRPGHG